MFELCLLVGGMVAGFALACVVLAFSRTKNEKLQERELQKLMDRRDELIIALAGETEAARSLRVDVQQLKATRDSLAAQLRDAEYQTEQVKQTADRRYDDLLKASQVNADLKAQVDRFKSWLTPVQRGLGSLLDPSLADNGG
jgi:chromosome segregation ATPase